MRLCGVRESHRSERRGGGSSLFPRSRRALRPEDDDSADDSPRLRGLCDRRSEFTDSEEARRILDSASQFFLPPEHWTRLRRGTLPTDRALTGRAIDWLLALPPTLRPQNLSVLFPRITKDADFLTLVGSRRQVEPAALVGWAETRWAVPAWSSVAFSRSLITSRMLFSGAERPSAVTRLA